MWKSGAGASTPLSLQWVDSGSRGSWLYADLSSLASSRMHGMTTFEAAGGACLDHSTCHSI